MAKKSYLEEAMASPWNDMEQHLNDDTIVPFRFDEPMDCDDDDYRSYVEYHMEH